MSDDKTEDPTPQKLQEAKRKGQSPKSQDVDAAAGLLAATICLSAAAPSSLDHLQRIFDRVFDPGFGARGMDQLQQIALAIAGDGLMVVLPFLAVSIVAGLVSGFAQTGINITFEPLSPKFDAVNPASGIKKIFSLKSLIELGKSVLKAILLGSAIYLVSLRLLPTLVGSALQDPAGVARIAWSALFDLLGAAVIVFIVIAPIDFGLQRWLFLRGQRMSKDEVKREHKQSEGDPMLKGQRKQLARELATSDPKTRVPGASVVVTNPTHYAVALRYVRGETPLPVVVAKGVDAAALRVREIAEQHGVPIIGNPPLARALYKVEVDQPVPEPLFEAVAAVMRWVATLDQMKSRPGPPAEGSPPTST